MSKLMMLFLGSEESTLGLGPVVWKIGVELVWHYFSNKSCLSIGCQLKKMLCSIC